MLVLYNMHRVLSTVFLFAFFMMDLVPQTDTGSFQKNTWLKAAVICLNNRNNIVAEDDGYIVAHHEQCLLKK